MTAFDSNIKLKNPDYYHREYSNDLGAPKNISWSNQTITESAQRVLNVALPFITLYKPMSFPVSLGLGAVRTVSSVFQLVSCIKEGKDTERTAYQALQTTIAVASLAGTIFAHPVGMLITTAQDLLLEVANLTELVKNGESKKALASCMNILNNTLYLALFLHGGLELSIAYLGMQILTGLYHGKEEFQAGKYLEGAGHVAMAIVRGKQMADQVNILQFQRKLTALQIIAKTYLSDKTKTKAELLQLNLIAAGVVIPKTVLEQEDLQPLFKAIANNNLKEYSKLIKKIDINSYYRDNFDDEDEGTLISMALLNSCFLFGSKDFIKKTASNKPDVDLAISFDDDGYSSQSLKSWLLEEKQEIEANIAAGEFEGWFELGIVKAYLSKVNLAIKELGIK